MTILRGVQIGTCKFAVGEKERSIVRVYTMIEQLTEKQREVLALVADNRTSKEIARIIGVSESAVNQRIESVRRLSGGLGRAELARLWREQDGPPGTEPTCNPLTGQSSQLTDTYLIGDEAAAGRLPFGTATPEAATGSHRPADDRPLTKPLSVLPAVLDGPQGAFHRLALVAVMAAAIMVIAVSALTIVDTLATLGEARSGQAGASQAMRPLAR